MFFILCMRKSISEMEAFCCGKIKRERGAGRQAGKASDGKSPTIFYFLRKNLVNGIIQKSKNLQFYFSGRCGKRLCCVFFTTRIHAHSTQNYKLLETIMCTFFFIMAFNSYMRVADFAFLRFRLWEFSFFVCASFFLYYIKALAITIEYTLCMYT